MKRRDFLKITGGVAAGTLTTFGSSAETGRSKVREFVVSKDRHSRAVVENNHTTSKRNINKTKPFVLFVKIEEKIWKVKPSGGGIYGGLPSPMIYHANWVYDFENDEFIKDRNLLGASDIKYLSFGDVPWMPKEIRSKYTFNFKPKLTA